jgi:hypothetical protein
LIIEEGGRYSKMDRQGAAQSLIRGTISITEQPPMLRLNIKDYEPKEWCGPLGCTPIRMIAAENYRYLLDKGFLLLWDQNGGPYKFQRLQ